MKHESQASLKLKRNLLQSAQGIAPKCLKN